MYLIGKERYDDGLLFINRSPTVLLEQNILLNRQRKSVLSTCGEALLSFSTNQNLHTVHICIMHDAAVIVN